MAVRGGVTLDGRCFRCVQRARYVFTKTYWSSETPRHLVDDEGRLCEKPKSGRGPRAEKMRVYQARYEKKWIANNPEAYRLKKRRQALRKYGITPDEFDRVLQEQGGLCASCQEEPATDVDHDHETGEFRGILCGLCNRMIGQAKDNPERLLRGAEYLIRNLAQTEETAP